MSSIAILGADTMLAALPATPVQLAHACLQVGYDLSVPASWGDELIAAECLHQLADRGARPAVMCACPHVRNQLLAVGPDLGPMLVPLVSPPVAVARYLRTLYGRDGVHLTYVGSCPAGGDQALDVHRAPCEFLASLATAGISLTDQPKVFDSVIPPDRRRFFSVAGGVPSAEQLWSAGNGRSLVELDGEDYLIDLAQHLLSHECALIDLAPRLGCACSGVSAAIPARSARAAVAVIDPPRASGAVVDMTLALELIDPLPSAVAPVDREPDGDRADGSVSQPGPREHPVAASAESPVIASVGERTAVPRRRRSPSAGIRSIQGSVPIAHVAGRRLPRAYVASRRPGQPVSLRTHIEPSVTRMPPVAASDSASDENGRSRAATRVAASPRSSGPAGPAAAVAAGAAGSPERMGDGPPRS
jgi:iron only hydrogenase large subunit